MRMLLAATALALASLARADVLPPPEEITDLQRQLIGVWQQDGLSGRDGHGEDLHTMFFEKARYTIMGFMAVPSADLYSFSQIGGAYTAERISDSEIRVTLTLGEPAPGVTPPTRTLTFRPDGPDHMIVREAAHSSVDVGYTRVTPRQGD